MDSGFRHKLGEFGVNPSPSDISQAPWGGVKDSGFGRELGEFGIENFLSVKSITTYEGSDVWPWYPQPAAKL